MSGFVVGEVTGEAGDLDAAGADFTEAGHRDPTVRHAVAQVGTGTGDAPLHSRAAMLEVEKLLGQGLLEPNLLVIFGTRQGITGGQPCHRTAEPGGEGACALAELLPELGSGEVLNLGFGCFHLFYHLSKCKKDIVIAWNYATPCLFIAILGVKSPNEIILTNPGGFVNC